MKSFDHGKLKHVETKEKVTLPGAGGLYLWIQFIYTVKYLKEHLMMPNDPQTSPHVSDCSCFIIAPLDIRAEMMPDTLPDRSEVAQFDQSKLKHVETQKKEILPTKSG